MPIKLFLSPVKWESLKCELNSLQFEIHDRLFFGFMKLMQCNKIINQWDYVSVRNMSGDK